MNIGTEPTDESIKLFKSIMVNLSTWFINDCGTDEVIEVPKHATNVDELIKQGVTLRDIAIFMILKIEELKAQQ